eukprot:TRINITY_DN27779_c0_g1_i1.p1 TRINITY_DN27779_c0_g1~~TRINITY_DN27779_c0_g1_i1.p1  ORF type:complete len:664 (+),score=193.00 TRINITY_DN27779_c0_g1_i1:34-1992(+)
MPPPRQKSSLRWAFLAILLVGVCVTLEAFRMTAHLRSSSASSRGGQQQPQQQRAGSFLDIVGGGNPELEALRAKIRRDLSSVRAEGEQMRRESAGGGISSPVPAGGSSAEDTVDADDDGEAAAKAFSAAETASDRRAQQPQPTAVGSPPGAFGAASQPGVSLPPEKAAWLVAPRGRGQSGGGPLYASSAETAYEILAKHKIHTIVFNRTDEAILAKGAACSFPEVRKYPVGHKMLHSHKKRRRGEFTPREFAARMLELSEAQAVKGIQVAVIPGTAIDATANSIPILDSKNGQFSIFKHWGDRSLWRDLRFAKGAENGLKGNGVVSLPNYLQEQPALWAAQIPNAWVSSGNVYTCDYAFTTGACLWEMPQPHPVKADKNVARVAVLCDSWCRGYFHFTHEHLPRFASIYQMLKDDPSIYITAPSNRDFVRQYIVDVLGLSQNRLLGSGTVFAKEVLYPQPQMCGNMWTHSLILLRKIVFERHGLHHLLPEKRKGALAQEDPKPYTGKEKFFVVLAERAGGKSGKSRMPTNYEEVKGRLLKHFPDVVFESSQNKSTLEQVKVFNQADMVIGPHGANLANIMWCRHGAAVIEFMSYKYGNLCYYATAQRLGLDFRFIMQPKTKGGAYAIDFEEVVKHIEDARAKRAGKALHVFE